MDRLLALAVVLFVLAAAPASAADKRRPMKLEDLYKFKRVSDPEISPDGKLVAYAVTDVDLEGNTSASALWLAPADGKGKPRQLTTNKKDRHPRWSPDGKQIAF